MMSEIQDLKQKSKKQILHCKAVLFSSAALDQAISQEEGLEPLRKQVPVTANGGCAVCGGRILVS